MSTESDEEEEKLKKEKALKELNNLVDKLVEPKMAALIAASGEPKTQGKIITSGGYTGLGSEKSDYSKWKDESEHKEFLDSIFAELKLIRDKFDTILGPRTHSHEDNKDKKGERETVKPETGSLRKGPLSGGASKSKPKYVEERNSEERAALISYLDAHSDVAEKLRVKLPTLTAAANSFDEYRKKSPIPVFSLGQQIKQREELIKKLTPGNEEYAEYLESEIKREIEEIEKNKGGKKISGSALVTLWEEQREEVATRMKKKLAHLMLARDMLEAVEKYRKKFLELPENPKMINEFVNELRELEVQGEGFLWAFFNRPLPLPDPLPSPLPKHLEHLMQYGPMTPLMYAISFIKDKNLIEQLELYSYQNITLNAEDGEADLALTPLAVAVRNDDLVMVQRLVEWGADVETSLEKGQVYVKTGKKIIEKGVEIDEYVKKNRTAFDLVKDKDSKNSEEIKITLENAKTPEAKAARLRQYQDQLISLKDNAPYKVFEFFLKLKKLSIPYQEQFCKTLIPLKKMTPFQYAFNELRDNKQLKRGELLLYEQFHDQLCESLLRFSDYRKELNSAMARKDEDMIHFLINLGVEDSGELSDVKSMLGAKKDREIEGYRKHFNDLCMQWGYEKEKKKKLKSADLSADLEGDLENFCGFLQGLSKQESGDELLMKFCNPKFKVGKDWNVEESIPPLQYAISIGNKDLVALLEKYTNPNAELSSVPTRKSVSPLGCAVFHKNKEAVKKLISMGAIVQEGFVKLLESYGDDDKEAKELKDILKVEPLINSNIRELFKQEKKKTPFSRTYTQIREGQFRFLEDVKNMLKKSDYPTEQKAQIYLAALHKIKALCEAEYWKKGNLLNIRWSSTPGRLEKVVNQQISSINNFFKDKYGSSKSEQELTKNSLDTYESFFSHPLTKVRALQTAEEKLNNVYTTCNSKWGNNIVSQIYSDYRRKQSPTPQASPPNPSVPF